MLNHLWVKNDFSVPWKKNNMFDLFLGCMLCYMLFFMSQVADIAVKMFIPIWMYHTLSQNRAILWSIKKNKTICNH